MELLSLVPSEDGAMTHVLWPLLGLTLLAADDEKSSTLRYLRPAGDKYVLESEVATTTNGTGSTLVSRTVRGPETMTLTLHFDKDGRVVQAEALLDANRMKKTAVLAFREKGPTTLKRGGITDYLKASPDVVVSTEPDWSDVFQLVRRYDAKKGGKQEFAGFWFHPVQAYGMPTFTIERVGTDKIMVNKASLPLERYQVHLRDGNYLVWADETGKVCKVLPQKKGEAPVVLEGIEEATKDLK
jgi:hypothetical protein